MCINRIFYISVENAAPANPNSAFVHSLKLMLWDLHFSTFSLVGKEIPWEAMGAFCQTECFPLLKSSHSHSSALSSHFSAVLASILVNLTMPAGRAVRSIMHEWSSTSCLLTVHFLLTCCLPPTGFGCLTKKDTSVSLCVYVCHSLLCLHLGKQRCPLKHYSVRF